MDGPSTPSGASSSSEVLSPPPDTPLTARTKPKRRRSSTRSREGSASSSGRPLIDTLPPPPQHPSNGSSRAEYIYPLAVEDVTTLSEDLQDFKLARFLPCRNEGCYCSGLRPPKGSEVRVQRTLGKGKGKEKDLKPILWDQCGRCGHGWRVEDEPDGGHTLGEDVVEEELQRRRRVAGRLEEMYDVSVWWTVR
jgi:hypothetical protein